MINIKKGGSMSKEHETHKNKCKCDSGKIFEKMEVKEGDQIQIFTCIKKECANKFVLTTQGFEKMSLP